MPVLKLSGRTVYTGCSRCACVCSCKFTYHSVTEICQYTYCNILPSPEPCWKFVDLFHFAKLLSTWSEYACAQTGCLVSGQHAARSHNAQKISRSTIIHPIYILPLAPHIRPCL